MGYLSDVERAFSTCETAGLGDIYHYTDVNALFNILEKKRIRLTSVERVGGTETTVSGRGDAFFLSLTRSKIGGYHSRGGANYGVLLHFDYDVLRHNNKIKPIDYWGPSFRKADSSMDEMEERLFSNNQWLDLPKLSKTIKSIHVLVKSSDERLSFKLRRVFILAKANKIKIYAYTNHKDWMAMRPRRAIPLNELLPYLSGKEVFPSQGKRTNWLAEYYELWAKPLGKKLTSRAERISYNILYHTEDAFRSFDADLHNAQKSEYIGKLAKVIKDLGGKKAFIEFIENKYTK